MSENFSPEKLYMHYFSSFKNNYREFLQHGKILSYKKYLYSMRGLLNAKYVLIYDKLPPIDFTQTIEELKTILPENVYLKTKEIIDLKSRGQEKEKIGHIKELDNYFDEELKNFNTNFNRRYANIEVFNKFLLQCLAEK